MGRSCSGQDRVLAAWSITRAHATLQQQDRGHKDASGIDAARQFRGLPTQLTPSSCGTTISQLCNVKYYTGQFGRQNPLYLQQHWLCICSTLPVPAAVPIVPAHQYLLTMPPKPSACPRLSPRWPAA
jgi:hypothetical protein